MNKYNNLKIKSMKQKFYLMNKLVPKSKFAPMLALFLGAGVNVAAAPIEIEAENFEVENSLYASNVGSKPNFSGNAVLSMRGVYGSYARYTVNAPEAGVYDITFSYTTMDVRYISIKVNNQVAVPLAFTDFVEWDGQDGINEKTTQIYLEAGVNTLELGGYKTWSPNIDKFVIEKSTADYTKPATAITPIVLEAENADVITGSSGGDSEFKNFSGGKGVSGNSSQGFKLEFSDIDLPSAGTYDVYVYYASKDKRYLYLQVDNKKRSILEFSEMTSGWGNDDHNDENTPAVYKLPVSLYMNAGKNKLTVGAHNGWSPNIDKIEIVRSGAVVADPGIEVLSYVFDYTDLATFSESVPTNQANLDRLNDNNEHTLYVGQGTQAQIVAELPYPIILTGYAYATDIESPSSNGWIVEYSENGQDWIFMTTTQSKQDNGFWTYNTDWKLTSSPIMSAKYYRLTAKSASGNVNIGEWQLFGSPYVSAAQNFPDDLIEMTNDGHYTGFLTSTHEGFYEGEYDERYINVLDKKVSTKYTATGTKTTTLTYETIGSKIAKSYSLTVPYSDSYSSRNPKDWTLRGLTEKDEWIILDAKRDIAFPVKGTTLIFNIKPVECFAYELKIENTAGANDCHLLQWQLFGDSVPPPPIPVGINPIVVENNIKVIGAEGKIILWGNDVHPKYKVYDLTGKLVKTGDHAGSSSEISVSRGIYIVRINNVSSKVIVK